MNETVSVDLRAVQTLTTYVLTVTRGLAEQPEAISGAPAAEVQTTVEIIVTVPPGQVGRVLGRGGQNIQAVRRLAQARGKLLGLNQVRVTVQEVSPAYP